MFNIFYLVNSNQKITNNLLLKGDAETDDFDTVFFEIMYGEIIQIFHIIN